MGQKQSTGIGDESPTRATVRFSTGSSPSSATTIGPSATHVTRPSSAQRQVMRAATVAYRSRATTTPGIFGTMAAGPSDLSRADALFFGYPPPERAMSMHSKPTHGIACPVCNVTFRELAKLERHLAECLPRACAGYNEDVLMTSMSADVECSICLEPFEKGHTVARLPCTLR
eukprot:Opistho-1_new@17549